MVPVIFKIQIRLKSIQLAFRRKVTLKLKLYVENTESS